MISDIMDFHRNSRTLRSYSAFTKMCDFEQHKRKFAPTLDVICSGHNRANGFMGMYDSNTEIEHWMFSCGDDEKLQMQNINCSICGDFIYNKHCDDCELYVLFCPYTCICKCNNYFDMYNI